MIEMIINEQSVFSHLMSDNLREDKHGEAPKCKRNKLRILVYLAVPERA